MLTIKQIDSLEARAKRYLVKVEDNLYVEVQPTGSKSWVFSKMSQGDIVKKNFGTVSSVTLYEARRKRDDLLQQLEAQKAQQPQKPKGKTFEEVAEEWMQVKCIPNTESRNVERQRRRLDKYVLPAFGTDECRSITGPQVLQLLRRIEGEGHNDLAHAVATLISMILRFGVACGYTDHDVIPDLRGALAPVKVTHFASIHKPEEIGELLRRIEALTPCIAKFGLLLCAHTFCRPGEVRAAKWDEFDLGEAEWHIPAGRMKMRRPHIVPLSKQVLALLSEIKQYGVSSDYVLWSPRDPMKHIGSDSFKAAFRRLGYEAGSMTSHGFRSMASTVLNEHGWPADAIERQLAHVDTNKVRAAYNHAEFLDTRRNMVQWYSDFLDAVRDGRPIPSNP